MRQEWIVTFPEQKTRLMKKAPRRNLQQNPAHSHSRRAT
jgi:hypothetical protein